MDRLQKVIEAIDLVNSQDINRILYNEKEHPKELLYSQRASAILEVYAPSSSEYLQIAVRGHHIKRWHIRRDAYEMNRKGYLKWRTDLKMMHAQLLAEIMSASGYNENEVEIVKDLVMKKGLKTNSETQTLEDVICLLFLEHELEGFAQKHEPDKVVSILQKTWKKMSDHGHQTALKLDFSPEISGLVMTALDGHNEKG